MCKFYGGNTLQKYKGQRQIFIDYIDPNDIPWSGRLFEVNNDKKNVIPTIHYAIY